LCNEAEREKPTESPFIRQPHLKKQVIKANKHAALKRAVNTELFNETESERSEIIGAEARSEIGGKWGNLTVNSVVS